MSKFPNKKFLTTFFARFLDFTSSQQPGTLHSFTSREGSTAEAVLPLGRLGGRLGQQISGGGKFFEKKLKIGVFFWHFKKTKLIVAPLN
jgi:hypothetical protein